MKVRIEIDTRTFVRFWLVVIGFVLAGLLLYSARTALIIVVASFFLALILNGPVSRIASWLPGRSRIGGTALAYVAVLALLGAFTFLVIPPIVEQSAKFAQSVPDMIEGATARWGGIDEVIDRYGVRGQYEQALDSIQDNASRWASNIGGTLIAGAGSLFRALAAMLIVLVMAFLMLVEGPAWISRIWSVYKDKSRMEHHRDLAERMYRVVNGYVTGQLTVAFVAAACTGLAVFLLSLFFDLPSNLALPAAALVFIGAMIPMFGATVAGVIAGILIAFNDLTAAVIFGIYFIIYQQVENNIISPVIQARTVQLSALIVLVSITVGIYMFGIAGGIISIPIAGSIQVLIQDYLERSRKKEKPSKPIARIVSKLKSDEA